MLTPARIFLALGVVCQGLPQLAGANKLPWWLGLTFAGLGIFCQVITAATGPVQNNAALNQVAKEAVKQAKETGE